MQLLVLLSQWTSVYDQAIFNRNYNSLKTVNNHYLTQKLFLTLQRTQTLAILNTKQTIKPSLSSWCRSDNLKLPCSYTIVLKIACNWTLPPNGPSQTVGSTIKIRRSCMLRFKTVQSSWFTHLAWHPGWVGEGRGGGVGLSYSRERKTKQKATSEAMQPGVRGNWNPQSENSGFQLIRTNG
jgi:hypothetical protein